MTTPTSTLLRVTGRDALAVLHRIATQHLVDLAAGQARMTCFCDFRGRLLDRACVAVDQDGAVWLLHDEPGGDDLAEFVDRHVFREDVKIEDRSASRSVSVEFDSNFHSAPRARLEEVTTTWAGSIRTPWTVPVSGGVLFTVGGDATLPSHDEAARIRAGWPRHDHEVDESFTPFEVGLAHEVHLSKGCYTGQEALMRLVTYRSVRRRLVRVRGTGSAPSVPTDIVHGEAKVGRMTSAVAEGGGWVGLAVVQHGVIGSPGNTLAGAAIDAVEPFPSSQPLGLP